VRKRKMRIERKSSEGRYGEGVGKTFIHPTASVPLKLRHLNESTTSIAMTI